MRFFIKEKLGPKQSLTNEGFLLCEEVPIARTGDQLYGPNETPVSVGPNGYAAIERHPDDVFRPETIASMNGKPVVVYHPDGEVNPDNWKDHVVGVVMSPRRGSGALDDVILADLLIYDRDAIERVRDGLREVSCGYEADYREIEPGRGRQINIIGNHVALVEQGRCGPRCAIGDENTEGANMKKSVIEKIRDAFKSKDEGKLNEVLAEAETAPQTETHVHVHASDGAAATADNTMDAAVDARFKKVEDSVSSMQGDIKTIKDAVLDKKKGKDAEGEEEEESGEEEEEEPRGKDAEIAGNLGLEAPANASHDKVAKAKDSAYLEDSFQETAALAEIMSPGIRIPSFDRKADPHKTYDALCKFRRTVLDLVYKDADARSFMDGMLRGRELKHFSCDQVRTMFFAVGERKKEANSHLDFDGVLGTGGTGVKGAIQTPADLNKANAEFWAKRS
jgi:hypothetical protein